MVEIPVFKIPVFMILAVGVENPVIENHAEEDPLVSSFVTTYCARCHGGEDPASDLALSSDLLPSDFDAIESRVLRLVRDRVRRSEMPPLDAPLPSPALREEFLSHLERLLATDEVDPGRVTMRRLSRVEYHNTVRDLLGLESKASSSFPMDDLGYGFDNNGDVLTLSPLHLEKYLESATRLAEEAIALDDPDHPRRLLFDGEDLTSTLDQSVRGDGFHVLYTRGEIGVEVSLGRSGEYEVRALVYGERAGPDLPRSAVRVDGEDLSVQDVEATRGSPQWIEVRARLEQGVSKVSASFENDYYREQATDAKDRDRNLCVGAIEIVGPLDGATLPRSHVQIFRSDPGSSFSIEDRARSILSPLASRAFRRPVRADELERLVCIVEDVTEEASFMEGMRVALASVLCSPSFLFRGEWGEPRQRDGFDTDIEDFEIASRLSYFLWSSLPDDELFSLAAARRLRDPVVLEAQVHRMLNDARASSLTTHFASQWLELDNLEDVQPDAAKFPDFDEGLRDSMRRETELFFESVLREDRGVYDLLDANYTFLDERLARHYGIDGVVGDAFRRVNLEDGRRGGVITHASILTVTSNPTRTSPVKRGKWILDQVLDAPPPPPPPEAGALDEDEIARGDLSLREIFERHRRESACASCHTRMDTLGFALENFDAIGAWRETDGSHPIEASGALPDGRIVEGPRSLRGLLKDDPDFVRCLAKKLATFALGRGLNAADETAVTQWVASVPSNPTLEQIIVRIVRSEAFMRRREVTGEQR